METFDWKHSELLRCLHLILQQSYYSCQLDPLYIHQLNKPKKIDFLEAGLITFKIIDSTPSNGSINEECWKFIIFSPCQLKLNYHLN